MDFLTAFSDFMFEESGRIPDSYEGSKLLIFAFSCAVMSFIIIALDRICYSVINTSYLNLSYGTDFMTSVRLVLLWGIGAGFGGFLGSAGSILEITRSATIVVGISWPLILPRLIDSFTSEQAHQDPMEENDDE